MPNPSVDLNCDMGELPELIADGTQQALLNYVTSVNIACGAHAGDEAIMRATAEMAQAAGMRIGAHPGFPDRANFGRVKMALTPAQISDSVYEQLAALAAITQIRHVKPHGALYNIAARDRATAEAIAQGVARFDRALPLMGLAGSDMLRVWRDLGFTVEGEAFADRAYEADGSLRDRKYPDALITSPAQAAAQAMMLAARGDVQTICIHSDTPAAVAIAAAVAEALKRS